MKLFYSIRELAQIIDESVYNTADALAAAGVTMTHKGKPAELGGWTGGGNCRGNTIYIRQGYYDDPSPDEVLVLGDSLPDSWTKRIKLLEANEPDTTDAELSEDGSSTFKPRIGWQIALHDAWPAMRKSYGRDPTPAEAIRYLKKEDTSGIILNKGGDSELWWTPRRGAAKEVAFRTVETVISFWRTNGRLPS